MTYQISRNGSIIGTFSHLEVAKGLMDGTFLPTDHYWKSGMAGWETLQEFEFKEKNPELHFPKAQTIRTSKSKKYFWLVFAFFAPYFGAWRIIFDKSIGYSKLTKVFYTIWLIYLVWMIGFAHTMTSEYKINEIVELLDSDSIDKRREGVNSALVYATKNDRLINNNLILQNKLGEIYKNGLVDDRPNLVEAYAWFTIAATTHKVETREVREELSLQARDAQFELDEYERKRVVISREKLIQLNAIILRGYTPAHIVTLIDGEEDPKGSLASCIKSASESLMLLKKQMLKREIDEGDKRVKELKLKI
jgi:hypothetical protein